MAEGLDDCSRYPYLFAELLRRGYTDDEVMKIAGRNLLRAMRRMEAAGLLRRTNLGVAEIAAAVGYRDAGHFATLFRRLTRQTPSRYRAAVRAKLFSPE